MRYRTQFKVVMILSTLTILVSTTFIFHLTQSYYKNYVRGRRYYKHSRYQHALSYFASAIEIRPRSLEAIQYLIWTYAKLDRQDGVAQALKKMSEVDPGNRTTKKWLADTYYGLSDFPKAEQYYKELLSTEQTFIVQKKLAEVLVWQEKYEEALPILKDLVREKPKDHKLTELLADVCSWQKEYAEAIRLYKQLLSRDKGSTDIALKLAEVLRFANRNSEAVEIYNQYLKGSE